MTHEIVYIPEGITFGSQVYIVPPVLSQLSHRANLSNTENNKSYHWVDRGDTIAEFTLLTNWNSIPGLNILFGEKEYTVDIRSPVSGLFIHRGLDFCYAESRSLTAILLPDDEHPAENGHYMFDKLKRLCWSHRATYLKPSRYWSMGAFDVDNLRNILDEQVSFKGQYVDAMPTYSDYFNEARTKHPNLRPYLKHLL